jgi:hypothetical protein
MPRCASTLPSRCLGPRRGGGGRGRGGGGEYIKICEEEIADDYPLPKQAVKEGEEMDELLLFDEEAAELDPEYLPRRMLTDFCVYNAEVRCAACVQGGGAGVGGGA